MGSTAVVVGGYNGSTTTNSVEINVTGGGCAESYSDWDAFDANTNSDSNSYAHADSYTNGDGNSYAYTDCYADCNIHSNATATATATFTPTATARPLQLPQLRLPPPLQQHDRIAAAYTDATATADTAASSLALFRIMGTRENELVSPRLVVIGSHRGRLQPISKSDTTR